MTDREAIAEFQEAIQCYERIDHWKEDMTRWCEALKVAVKALRERIDRENNEPQTNADRIRAMSVGSWQKS